MSNDYFIVWERFSLLLEDWTPYGSAVSRLLDRAFYKALTRAELGDAEPALINFYVNLVDMKEFGPTNTVPVRRKLYPVMVPAIVGVAWEFFGEHWSHFPYIMQKYIEMAWMRGDAIINLMPPDSGTVCLIDLKSWCLVRKPGCGTFAIRRSKIVPYPILKTDSNARSNSRTIPAVVPEGWMIANEAPEQQVCEQMNQMINQGQREVTAIQVTPNLVSADQVTAEEQATGEELDPVCSLAKRLSNFFLGKSSDAPVNTSAPLCQPQVQQQFQGEMAPRASIPYGPPGFPDKPTFSGASIPHTVEISRESVENKPLLANGGERKVWHNHLVPESITAQAFDAGYLKVITPVPMWMQPCPVCQLDMLWSDVETLKDYPVAFSRCQHMVHVSCFLNIVQRNTDERPNKLGFHFECPTCHVIYGRKIGCQPYGTMEWDVKQYHLPGHEDTYTIEIMYNFQSSVQNKLQPRPGKNYFAVGFPRRCFLPYNNQGRLILAYLREAFDRRILFTIGRSATTGIEYVVQPCVEHKTKVDQFPDQPFFQRVIQQLVNLGVAD